MADFADVYYAALPMLDVEIEKIEHVGRRAELMRVKNERVMREKYFVWRLLEQAISNRLGKTPSEAGLFCDESGKWHSPHVYLSLSHAGAALAVALSDAPIGVDIEREVRTRAENFATRALNERELRELSELSDGERDWELVRLWTAKEAIFKAGEKKKFIPKETDTHGGVLSFALEVGGERYALSVASSVSCVKPIFVNLDENPK